MASQAIVIEDLAGSAFFNYTLAGIDYYAAGTQYYAHEEQINILEAIAAALLLVWAISIADDYFDLADDALDKQFAIADRELVIQEAIVAHYLANQHVQVLHAQGAVYGLTGPAPNYGLALTAGQSALSTGRGAIRGTHNMAARYRSDCIDPSCPVEADVFADISAVYASQQVMRHQEKRFYRMEAEYRDSAAAVYRGSRSNPDGIFSLMNTAAKNYSNIANLALQTADGLASLSGAAIGTFIGGVFGGRT